MKTSQIPNTGVLSRKASVIVNCDQERAFDFISSSEELPTWLKACGKIPGAQSVELISESYDFVGAKRKVLFQGGNHAEESLLSINKPLNYSYEVTHFSNFLERLSGDAYGQLWFDREGEGTRITWEYTFHYKNFLDRIGLSLFLSLVYLKFLKQSLTNAKAILEAKS